MWVVNAYSLTKLEFTYTTLVIVHPNVMQREAKNPTPPSEIFHSSDIICLKILEVWL